MQVHHTSNDIHEVGLLQAVYHGFGLRVTPSELVLGKGKPLQHAIERLLADPAFKVWLAIAMQLVLMIIIQALQRS